MFCKYCGKQLPDGTKFCRYCGKPLQAAQKPAEPVAPPVVPAAPVQPAAPVIDYDATVKMDAVQAPVSPVQPAAPVIDYDATVKVNDVQAPAEPMPPVQPIIPVQPVQPVTPVQPVQPVAPVQPVQPVAPQAPVYNPPPKKKSGGKIALIIVLVVLLLAGLGVGGYFVFTQFIQPSLATSESKEETEENKGEKEEGDETDEGSKGDKDDEDDKDDNDYTISRPDKNDPDDKNTDSKGEATAPNATQPNIPEPPVTEPPATEPPATEPNPYEIYINDQTDYILPDSKTSYLSYNDVSSLSVVELTIAKQEIYARYGAKAQDQDLQAYFESRSWYQESNYAYSLNSYEEKNLILLDTFLLQKTGGSSQSGNRYLMLYTDSSGYVISGSNNRYLYASDARNLSEDALYVAYYEIYARRGCLFDDSALQAYFYTKPWYTPSVRQSDFYDSSLNKYETNNLVLIRAYEKKAKKVPVGNGTEYYDEYLNYGNQDYIFSDSSYRYMSERELWGMNADELELARNEIYARHGYLFSDQALRDYFCTKEWYYPDTVMGDQGSLGFSNVELANIQLMRDYENLVE